jgi:glyoxylase-like metal-dependent hydrolase (beta-lactamase superfamily II)
MLQARCRSAFPFLLLLAFSCSAPPKRSSTWTAEGEHVWRSPGTPAAYALVDGEGVLVFGAAQGADLSELVWTGASRIEGVYLTHAHRDGLDAVPYWVSLGIAVHAPRSCEPLMSPEGVRRYWERAVPPEAGARSEDRAFPEWEYLVLAEGLEGVAYDVEDGRSISWRGWTVTPRATPGHARSHVAYLARRRGEGGGGRPLVFCGDALAASGTLWSPFTTDWDAASGEGLSACADSLEMLAVLEPEALFPEHGPAILQDAPAALRKTSERARAAAVLKSYPEFLKQAAGNAPTVRLLAREQLGSDGRLPWTQIDERLHVTGNTYAVVSREGPLWVVDPAGERITGQLLKVQFQNKAAETELVTLTDAHQERVSGVHEVPGKKRPSVWTLDVVAGAVGAPTYNRVPGVHPRRVEVTRAFRDGEGMAWREYPLRFHHLAAHTHFGSAIETTIDGKRCLFTGDAFLPAQLGGRWEGWSGMNQALPADLVSAAEFLRRVKPDRVLGSRGGAFEYDARDAESRLAWAQAAVAAADRLSPTGDHRVDWAPQLVLFEPFVTRTVSGREVGAEMIVRNPSKRPAALKVRIPGRGIAEADYSRSLELPANSTSRFPVSLRLGNRVAPGRYPMVARVTEAGVERPIDAFLIIDVTAR